MLFNFYLGFSALLSGLSNSFSVKWLVANLKTSVKVKYLSSCLESSSKLEVKSEHSTSSMLSLTHSSEKSNRGCKERSNGKRNKIKMYFGKNDSKSCISFLLRKKIKVSILLLEDFCSMSILSNFQITNGVEQYLIAVILVRSLIIPDLW